MHIPVLWLWWLFWENNWKEILVCENILWGLASEQGSVMIIGLLVNTGAKYGASIYGLYTFSYRA